MNFRAIALVIFLTSVSFILQAQRNVSEHARATITPSLMQQTISFLASDSMKGRATPDGGLDVAADYIASQFKSLGLQAFNGDYFQDLDYCYIDLGSDNFLSLIKGIETLNFKIKEDFVPYDLSGARPAESAVVFAGYGITAPEFEYDDYKDLDVKGKIVVVLRQEPGQTDVLQKSFDGLELTHYSGLKVKQRIAQAHGAAGIIVISGPLHYSSLKPRGYAWPSLSKILPEDALPLDYCDSVALKIPMVQAGESVVNELFGNIDSLKRIQQRIEKSLQPHSFRIPGKIMAMNVSLITKPVGGRNVVAWLEGSDPVLKNEVIIIGGHYDHIGFEKEPQGKSDFIYNGADDNASGTSGVLAVAKAFATMAENPQRSVIFIAFAGEEKGLLGSSTYVHRPLWPLNKTVAMINLDMIARNDPDSVQILGARQNPGLAKVVRKENKEIGFKLAVSKSKYLEGGSDHVPFFKSGVPVIFFFTGLHEDYHQVTDNPDRINADKAARVSRLAFLTAWAVANESRHYKIVHPAGRENE